MPYVDAEARDRLAHGGLPTNAGELNYWLSLDIDQYIEDKGLSYQTLNDVAGVLNCLNLEIYRRITAEYENMKIHTNGDVFAKALALLKKVGLAILKGSVAPQYDPYLSTKGSPHPIESTSLERNGKQLM